MIRFIINCFKYFVYKKSITEAIDSDDDIVSDYIIEENFALNNLYKKYCCIMLRKVIFNKRMNFDFDTEKLIIWNFINFLTSTGYYRNNEKISIKQYDKILKICIDSSIKYIFLYPNLDFHDEDKINKLLALHVFYKAYYEVIGKNIRNRFKEYKVYINGSIEKSIPDIKNSFESLHQAKIIIKLCRKFGMYSAKKIINMKDFFYCDAHKKDICHIILSCIFGIGTRLLKNGIRPYVLNKIFYKITNCIINLAKINADKVFDYQEFTSLSIPFVRAIYYPYIGLSYPETSEENEDSK